MSTYRPTVTATATATVMLGMFAVATLAGACKAEPKAAGVGATGVAKATEDRTAVAERLALEKAAADKLADQVAAADKAIAEANAIAEAKAAADAKAADAEATHAEREASLLAVRAVMATEPPLAPLPVQYEPDSSLPEKIARRIRFRLRELSKAPIALTQIVYVPRDDGSGEVFALYQTSRYEECVRGYPNRLEGRKHCLMKGGSRQLACVRGGVVWASFAPPSLGTPAGNGGVMAVQTLPFDTTLCTLEAKEMVVGDLDENGTLELMLTLLEAHEPPADHRGMWNHEYAMTFYLLPSGLSPGKVLRAPIASWYRGNGEDGLEPEPPFELRDVNRDGRRDLVEYALQDNERCRSDGEPRDLEEGEPNPCVRANRAWAIYAYDEDDAWWSPASRTWLETLAARLTP